MTARFAEPGQTAIPVHVVRPDTVEEVLSNLPAAAQGWARAQGFSGGAGACLALPDAAGEVVAALIGLGPVSGDDRHRFLVAKGASTLPEGTYEIVSGLEGGAIEEAALGWLLETYRFDRYKDQTPARAALVAPDGVDAHRLEIIAEGEFLTRDLINTPAADLGPDALEAAARKLADSHGATINVTTGGALLDANLPMIHAVGRAAEKAPRLIDIHWGSKGPSLTLVGKGVCFDTGGLNIKPGASMAAMKKDMGGAATVLGLAHMIMSLALPMQLRVLIPAVENNIAGNAFRPGDILTSRSGQTVEINNTDAEGRLVLADALTLGAESAPDLMISMATLTGAARVAVGPDLAPFFSTAPALSDALRSAARRVADPVWELPFHAPYEEMIEPGIADLDNAPRGGFAGATTAALFLRRFTDRPYLHFDIFASTLISKPGRPKGGLGQGARAILEALPELIKL